MKWIERLKEFLGTGLGVLLTGIFVVGNLYWLWLAFQFGKYWMYAAVLIVPTAFITAPIGVWALVFGTPNWLIDITKDTDLLSAETITEEQLRSFASSFNETLPLQVMPYLTLMNLSIRSGPTMAFTYVWEAGSAVEAYLENPQIGDEAAILRACSDAEGLRMFLDDGITLQYIAHKSDGTQVYDIEYDVSDCQSNDQEETGASPAN